MFAMSDLPRNNFHRHLGEKLGTVLGHEVGKVETAHTNPFQDELLEFLVEKSWEISISVEKDKERIRYTLTGCPPVLYPDIMPDSFE